MFQRIVSLVLSFILVFSLVPFGAFAEDDSDGGIVPEGDVVATEAPAAVEPILEDNTDLEITTQETFAKENTPVVNTVSGTIAMQVNPLYAGLVQPKEISGDWELPALFAELVYGTISEAETTIREAMKVRVPEFTVHIQTTQQDFEALHQEMLFAAMAHTGIPTEGDYLRYQLHSYGGGYNGEYDDQGNYYMTFRYALAYHDTPDHNDVMDSAVAALLSQLNLYGKSDYAKICGIYDWMCANITYDNANLNNPDYTLKYTAYAALVDGTAVCQGYANLFYRLALELGVNSRIITGIGNGGPHAWNIVKLDGEYYDVDATWDAGRKQANLSYNWFLKNEAAFSQDHTRDAEYSNASFVAAYPMADVDYSPILGSGTHGANLSWVLDREGKLTISGEGIVPVTAPWKEYCDSVKTVVIGDDVMGIMASAFQNYANLTSVTISDSVINIGEYAFHNCTSLTSVTIGSGVTDIGEAAFRNCTSLTGVTIPASVRSIERNSFAYCSGISQFVVDKANNYYSNDQYGALFNKAQTILMKCPGTMSGTYTIPDSVTEIDFTAFSGCGNLTGVEIPSSVKVINSYAFDGCENLSEITMPGSIEKLGSAVFQNCTGLGAIVFEGDAPKHAYGTLIVDLFGNTTAAVCYPVDNETWTDAVRQNYGGTVTWTPYGDTSPFVSVKTVDELMIALAKEEPFIAVAADMEVDELVLYGGITLRVNDGVELTVNQLLQVEAGNVLTVSGSLTAHNDAILEGELTVEGQMEATGRMQHFGETQITGQLTVSGQLNHQGAFVVDGGSLNVGSCEGSGNIVAMLNTEGTSVTVPGDVFYVQYLYALETADDLKAAAAVAKNYPWVDAYMTSSIQLEEDLTIPSSLGIDMHSKQGSEVVLTVPQGVTLTNEGNISINPYAKLTVQAGAVLCNANTINIHGGTLENNGSYQSVDGLIRMDLGEGGRVYNAPYRIDGTVADLGELIDALDILKDMESQAVLQIENDLEVLCDLEIPANVSLIVEGNSDVSFIVDGSVTVTNKGSMFIRSGATLINMGTIDNQGVLRIRYDGALLDEGTILGKEPLYTMENDREDDARVRLFTRWDDGSGYMESSEIRLDCTSPLVFCFGTYDDHIYVSDLETIGAAVLGEQQTAYDGAPYYNLGVSGMSTGAVKYTHTDGTEYLYSVAGILGYEGDLIALCTDETRGYDGLEFTPYLAVGDSFEAEFAVLDSMTSYQMLPEDAELTAESVATLEKVDGTVYRIGVSGEGEGQIHYTYGDKTGTMYVWGYVGGEGPGEDYIPEWCQTVMYQGQEVSVFIGDVWGEELHDIQGYGDNYGATYFQDMSYHLILGAFTGYETDKEALVPAGFYDCISQISFHLEDARNEFGDSDKLNCWLSNIPDGAWQDCTRIAPVIYENSELGIKSAQTYIRAKAGKGFYAKVCMTFTYDDPSDDVEAATYTVKIDGFYRSSGDIKLDLSTGENAALVDTAAELNEILSSYDQLIDWIEQNFPEIYASYAPGGTVELTLPVVTYEDVIVVQAKPTHNSNGSCTYIKLHGSADAEGNRTTVPGILARAGLFEVLNLDFVYDPEATYDDIWGNNKELSYGILADASQRADAAVTEEDAFWNDICNVGNCTFAGFDYGMCSTEYGYAGPAWGCTFTDCYYGIYIDCQDQGSGGNDDFSGNTFTGSKFAVCLRSLPGNSTPYSMRFHDNVFLNNHKEFKVTTSGNKHYFYFYRNYYSGAYHDGLMLLTEEEEVARGAEVEVVDENGVQSNAVVLTDPCRTNQDMSEESGLWIFGDSASILNTEAGELLIAEDALADTQISVLNSEEEEIAVWDFRTEE